MAINPPSDIVLGVAAAADPAKARAAAEKLARAEEEPAGFETVVVGLAAAARPTSPRPLASSGPVLVAKTSPAGPVVAEAAASPVAASPPPTGQLAKPTEKANAEAMQKLEAFFLQSFVEAMLPKQAETIYGSGLAGDVWKSMLAEQIAAEIARSTKFGVAERLAGQHFQSVPQTGAVPPSAARQVPEKATGQNLPYVKDAPRAEAQLAALLGGPQSEKRGS